MYRRTAKKACIKLLAHLQEIKYCELEKESLEENLVEMNRLVAILTAMEKGEEKIEAAEVSGETRKIGGVLVKRGKKRVEIVSSDIPGLEEYFRAEENQLLLPGPEDVEKYLSAIQEKNRVCYECLRRSSMSDTLTPLVMVKKPDEILLYHIECYEEIRDREDV